MRKLMFYGDSNTYGYDPADWQEGRFPAEKRWTFILQQLLGEEYLVIPEGLNGRRIPDLSLPHEGVQHLLAELEEKDLFAVMLGTNDILFESQDSADKAVRRMRAFVDFLLEYRRSRGILLIAPPCSGSPGSGDPIYRHAYEECRKMNQGFAEIAGDADIWFADAADWGIDLAFDEVHFSEEGSKRFAVCLSDFLRTSCFKDEIRL